MRLVLKIIFLVVFFVFGVSISIFPKSVIKYHFGNHKKNEISYTQKTDSIIIVAFGNSITATRKTINKVFAQRIDELLAKKGIEAKIINSGIPGSHTGHQEDNNLFKIRHALDRFKSDVLDYNPDIVIIGFGTNDAHIDNDHSYGPSRIPLTKYRDNLEFMIQELLAKNINIILIAPNILGNKYGDIQNKRLIKYVDVVCDLAHKYKTGLVNNYQLFIQYQLKTGISYETLMLDGVHPNDKGHKLIAKQLMNEIMNILRRNGYFF